MENPSPPESAPAPEVSAHLAAAPEAGAHLDPLLECEGFDQLGLAPIVLDTVQALGYEVPTPIQCQCIPHLLAGRDLLGQAHMVGGVQRAALGLSRRGLLVGRGHRQSPRWLFRLLPLR